MAISEIYSGTLDMAFASLGGVSLLTNAPAASVITTPGVFQLYIDTTDMRAGHTFTIFIKEKITAGGTQKTIYSAALDGTQSAPFVSPGFILYHGWDFRLEWTERTIDGLPNMVFDWSIRQIA